MPRTTTKVAPTVGAGTAATAARPPAKPAPVAQSASVTPPHHVCPFCGAVNDKLGKPCPRCTLEDTPETRQATKLRIGPWYVLQNRNPAAPGMRFQTLQSLIRKGLVNQRSIVRGPTTHQLWRAASRVKGLSREFGLCYSCGKEVERTANICPHCNRSQSLPANPDALLETPPVAGAPAPMRDAAAHPTSAHPAAARPAAPPLRSAPASQYEYADDIVIAALGDDPAAEAVAPAVDPVVAQRPERLPPSPDLLTPIDLAKAFSLGYEPPRRSRWRLKKRTKILTAIVLLVGGVGTTLYVQPSLGQSALDWVKGITQKGGAPKSAQPAIAAPKLATPKPAGAQSPATAKSGALTPGPDAELASVKTEPAPDATRSPAVVAAALAADFTSVDSSASEAKALWLKGLDAESRRDFAAAVKAYEAVQSLPSNVWPKELKTRLQLARENLKGGLR